MIPVFVVVVGWGVAHWQTSLREIEQRKAEFRVNHLREAYIQIANTVDQGKFPCEIEDLQSAFVDIQLFGEEEQIASLIEAIEDIDETQSANFAKLLKQLRNEIREHIGLEPLDSDRWKIQNPKRLNYCADKKKSQ